MKVFESHYDGDYGASLCLVAAPDAETAFRLVQECCGRMGDNFYMYAELTPEIQDGHYIANKRYTSSVYSYFTEFKEIEGLTFETDEPVVIRHTGYIE